MHALLHLPQCVRDSGPLWVTSCFSFESANGELTKLFHGTQNVECQIVASVNIIQNLPTLMNSIPEQFSGMHRMHRFNPLGNRKFVEDMFEKFCGSAYSKLLTASLNEKLHNSFNVLSSEMQFFNRMIFRGQVYHSKDYTRVKQRNSYTVKYFCPESRIVKFGQILFLVTIKQDNLLPLFLPLKGRKKLCLTCAVIHPMCYGFKRHTYIYFCQQTIPILYWFKI